MAVKKVILPKIGEVSLYKRKGAKSMRISISHEGGVRLTLPKWTPYSAGIAFIGSHIDWINAHRVPDMPGFSTNMRIGKAHKLVFITDPTIKKVSTRITLNEARVILPIGIEPDSESAQKFAKTVTLRTLKYEAEELLPKKLNLLADLHGFSYNQIKIKQLKTRWGSCNNFKQITLSFYLMQLPWELIDYVILHELTHTKVLAHGPKFWEEFNKHLPNAKAFKKQINTYKPVIDTTL